MVTNLRHWEGSGVERLSVFGIQYDNRFLSAGNLLAVILYWWHAGPYFLLLKPRGDIFPLAISGNQGTGGSGKSDLMLQTVALSLDTGSKAEGTVRINLGQHAIIAMVSNILARLLQRTTAWVGSCPFLKPVPSASCWFRQHQRSFQWISLNLVPPACNQNPERCRVALSEDEDLCFIKSVVSHFSVLSLGLAKPQDKRVWVPGWSSCCSAPGFSGGGCGPSICHLMEDH